MAKKTGAAAGGGGRAAGRGRAPGTINTDIGPVYVADWGQEIPGEVREQGGLVMVHRGKVYVYPDPKLPDEHTFHADLVEALGWPRSDYDEAARLILDDYGKLAVSVGAVGWGRESRAWFRLPDAEVDARAMRKVGRVAKRLIGAGYSPEHRLGYWTASGSPIVLPLEDW